MSESGAHVAGFIAQRRSASVGLKLSLFAGPDVKNKRTVWASLPCENYADDSRFENENTSKPRRQIKPPAPATTHMQLNKSNCQLALELPFLGLIACPLTKLLLATVN